MERLLNLGWSIIWCGIDDTCREEPVDSEGSEIIEVKIKLVKGDRHLFIYEDVDIGVPSSYKVIRSLGMKPEDSNGVSWANNQGSLQGRIRAANVCGYGPLISPKDRLGKDVHIPELHVMGLDIEQTTYYRGGGFPLSTDPLISIAIVSNRNRYWCRHMPGKVDMSVAAPDRRYDIASCATSTEMVDWALSLLISECPDFVVIHNGFKYDIHVLAAHCSSHYGSKIKAVSLGQGVYGYDLNISGVTVVDSYHYLSKLHNGEYSSLSLNSLAQTCGLGSKAPVETFFVNPNDTSQDLTEMVVYNIHDSYLHVMVADRCRIIKEILTMSCTFRSPLSDVSRFISGTLVGLLVSAYSRSHGMVVEWNREPTPLDKFGGGFVLPPKQGVHKNVVVFDFSSMYPSIIVSANISSESVVTVTSEEEMSYWDERFSGGEIRSISSEITLKYDDEYICLQIGEQMGIIKRRVRSISCEVMKYLMDTRNSLEDRSGPQGWALKIGANSYYGALGSYTSGIGKRFAAACVTALGRLAIERLVKFLSELGHETLYGDTDSVFIKCSIGDLDGEISHSEMIEDTLKAYHNSLKGTVFEGIVLKYELTYDSLILLKRKMYFGIVADSKKVVVKGMASKRRDRPNISREVSMYVCNKICEIEDRSVLIKVLADYCHEIYLKVINGECSPYESMLETKEGSVLVWRYRAVDGTFVSVEKDKFVDSKHVPVSPEWLLESISSSVSHIMTYCKLVTFERMLEIYRENCDDLDKII